MKLTDEEFYGSRLEILRKAEWYLTEIAGEYPGLMENPNAISPVIYVRSRVKSADSMKRKLKERGFEENTSSALTNVYDAVGIRIVCGFVDDVYRIARWLERNPKIEIIEKKDYIAVPKPNGYRSLHLCIAIMDGEAAGTLAEIQLRTMALDFWATLEHQLKYKKSVKNETLIRSELKRCADEIASTDMSMQTIRDMLEMEFYY